MTNPSQATFRTHLTSLSFHTHLRRLSSSSSQSSPSRSDAKSVAAAKVPSTSSPSTVPKATNGKMDPKTPHILSFSNRISLSVRTPSYHFKSYGLFSVVVMPLSPLPPTNTSNTSTSANVRSPSAVTTATATTPAHSSTCRRKKGPVTPATGIGAPSTDLDILRADVWIGAFGRWFAWKWDAPTGITPAEVTEDDERRARVSRSVIKITTEDAPSKRSSKVPKPLTLSTNSAATSSTSDDPANSTEPPTSPTTRVGRSSRPAKRPLRGMQRRTSPNSLARLRSQVESNAAAAAAAASAAQGPDKTSKVSKDEVKKVAVGSTVTKDEERLRVNKDGPTTQEDVAKTTTTPDRSNTTPTGRTSGSSEDRVVQELQLQVEELRASTDDAERRLQEELEVLRGRKRDEDTSRQELKQRTKVLEEQKRIAELHRTETERELNERKSVVRAAQDRVDKMRNEILEIDKKEVELAERREKKKRDRKERERKLKEDVEKRKEELKKVEAGVNELADQVAGLERRLDARREVLQVRRHEIVARNMGLGRNGPVQTYPYAQPSGVMSRWRGGGAVGYPHGGAYAYSNNNSRPGSVRSGHYDHYHSNYQSAPSSPVQSSPITPFDDSALGGPRPPGMSSNLGPDAHRSPTSQGFLEHRLQHRRHDLASGEGNLSSAFLPFDFDTLDAPASSGSRPASINSPHDDANKGRPALALPMQYLDSGLLAGGDSSSINGPLSPMTPHQTSLIPSTLFHMLDEDDEDEGQFVMPDSPSLTAANGDAWKGLDLDLANDLTIGRPNRARDASVTRTADGDLGVDLLRRDSKSSGVKSPFSDGPSSSVVGSRSAVSSPALVPASTSATTTSPASSSFAPWDTPAEGMHVNRPSSMEQHDDLPRAGLSLNPDAKAFAFSPRATSATIPTSSSTNLLPTLVKGRSASNPPLPTGIVALHSSSSGNGPSSLTVVDPFSPSFNSVIAPPPKSRMDFGHRLSPNGHSSLGSRFAFDAWASSPLTPSPEATTQASTLKSNFNPFADDGDDLLGPLKQ
ncbi:BZ3500_MvSof-1268-A1-R1_Chr1-1g01169 [Microbotryum saponariae]|uniref:BZ3500_MvSof-1268-A1-R1_Chr1-1g01169 protein n=1 Tax=Microbotryum saponariae TaxID=289078 RepID=A0A2X0MMI8_9BASI|nr:BZ3500_MvSof-1268-A1-R1_Chr1-1g01169 [Microbotryum saponariae]SCZ93564.1 BZ3501_MvSof-1269-A2-R1_Chr1-1g00765 [Microbotryum saponariae]